MPDLRAFRAEIALFPSAMNWVKVNSSNQQ